MCCCSVPHVLGYRNIIFYKDIGYSCPSRAMLLRLFSPSHSNIPPTNLTPISQRLLSWRHLVAIQIQDVNRFVTKSGKETVTLYTILFK